MHVSVNRRTQISNDGLLYFICSCNYIFRKPSSRSKFLDEDATQTMRYAIACRVLVQDVYIMYTACLGVVNAFSKPIHKPTE
jgi:hypothetical protein